MKEEPYVPRHYEGTRVTELVRRERPTLEDVMRYAAAELEAAGEQLAAAARLVEGGAL